MTSGMPIKTPGRLVGNNQRKLSLSGSFLSANQVSIKIELLNNVLRLTVSTRLNEIDVCVNASLQFP